MRTASAVLGLGVLGLLVAADSAPRPAGVRVVIYCGSYVPLEDISPADLRSLAELGTLPPGSTTSCGPATSSVRPGGR